MSSRVELLESLDGEEIRDMTTHAEHSGLAHPGGQAGAMIQECEGVDAIPSPWGQPNDGMT